MADIALIGDRDCANLAKATGIETHGVAFGEDAGKLIQKLAKSGTKVIFVTCDVYAASQETIDKYRNVPYPIITPIPDSTGNSGVAMQAIKANVEKAIGMDILFSEEHK